MYKYLLIAFLGLMPSLAMANSTTVGDTTFSLSAEQIAKLTAEAAALQANNVSEAVKRENAPIPPAIDRTIEVVDKFSALGKAIGAGLVSTAKELGVTANEFSQTPVGKLTVFLIVYKLIGHDIIDYTLGILWFVVSLSIWFYVLRRYTIINRVYRDEKGHKVVEYMHPQCKDDHDYLCGMRWGMFFVLVPIVLVGLVFLI